jgi:putative sterol carrier protein
MSEYQERALDFMTKLYTLASEDPEVQKAAKGKDLVLEFRVKDMPDFAMQLVAKDDKQTVRRGSEFPPTVVVEYKSFDTLREYWADEIGGTMLMVTGKIRVTRGQTRQLLFLGSMEKALRRTFEQIKDQYPR